MHELTCATCGSEFTFHRRKKYCSTKCRKSPIKRKKQKTKISNRSCLVCGETFSPNRVNARYCSLRCKQNRIRRYDTCVDCGEQVPATSEKVRLRCERCRTQPFSSLPDYSCVDFKKCRCCVKWYCIKPMNVGSYSMKYCASCVGRYGYWYIDRIISGLLETQCRECEVRYSFLPQSGGMYKPHMSSLCSEECVLKEQKKHKRIHKAKRRKSVVDGENIDPFEIFERDGWRCKHCKKKTPKRHRGTLKETAPEMDHIVPLSVGGKHIKRNVQTLCRKCNMKKSNGTLFDQLLLVG